MPVLSADTPVRHRAIPLTCDLGDYQAPDADVDPPSGKLESMNGTDPAAIVVSRRTLGWAGAALFALFSGGQVASLKLVGADGDGSAEPDPAVTALAGRVDSLTTKMDQLTADGQKRDQHFNRVLRAVLIWQLEQDRYYRETRQPGTAPRSQELEEASQRLRELAQEK